MAKRRSEDCLRFESPSKRCCAPRSPVDKPPGSMALTSGGGSPPALLALLGSRCRKRPLHSEDQESQVESEAALHGKATRCDVREGLSAVAVHTSGSFQEPRVSSGPDKHPSKRPRTDSRSSEANLHENADEDNKEKNTEEDSAYNSFQYWRVPLPKLDLSLLEDTPQTKDKSKLKDYSSDAMES